MLNKKSKILITGGKGFLGYAVCKTLTYEGYKNFYTFGSDDCDLLRMGEAQKLFEAVNPDIVIHLAARVGGIGANKANPGKFAYENLIMGTNVIECCRQHSDNTNKKVKLVIAGTICAYPKFAQVPFKEESLWDGYPEETNAPYGLAKKMLLVLAQSYRQQYGSNFIYLLPVNLFGPGDNFDLETSHVIPAMIRKMHIAKINNEPSVTLWGDGSPTREFLYVDDCALAFVRAMEKYDGELPINIGCGKELSMTDLANQIKFVVGYNGSILWDISKPNGQPRRCLDVSRAQKHLGWQASTSLQHGLSTTYQWFLGNQERFV